MTIYKTTKDYITRKLSSRSILPLFKFLVTLNQIAIDSPSNTDCAIIAFGDSLRGKVAGWIGAYTLGAYSFGNSSVCLDSLGAIGDGTGVSYGTVPAVTLTGGSATVSGSYAIWPSGSYTNVPSGGSAQWGVSGGTPFSEIKIFYIVESGGGTFDLQTSTDGTTWTTRSTLNASGATAGAVASYTGSFTFFRVNCTSASIKLVGISCKYFSRRSITLGSLGANGLSIINAAQTPSSIMVPILSSIAPSLVTVHMDDSATDLSAYLPTVLSWFRTAAPSCSILLIGNTAGSASLYSTAVEQQNYYDYLAASMTDCVTASLSSLADNAQITSAGMQGDNIHLNDAFYAQAAVSVLSQIGFPLSTIRRIDGTALKYSGSIPVVRGRLIEIARLDIDTTPALQILTDNSFGLDGYIKATNRSVHIQDSAGASLFIGSNNQVVYPHQIPAQVRLGSISTHLNASAATGNYPIRVVMSTAYNNTTKASTFAAANVLETRENSSGTSAMLIGESFQALNATLQTFSLPTSGVKGQRTGAQSIGAAGVDISQGAGQQIVEGTSSTTVGTSGKLHIDQYSSIELESISTDGSKWMIVKKTGSVLFT